MPLAAGDLRDLIGEPIAPARFDPREFDPATNPCADLDAFVNARWRAARPLPPDRSAWDCFAILAERSLQAGAEVAVAAAHADEPRTPAERVVGDFWRSGMDAAAITGLGRTSLDAEFARIDALATPEATAAYLCERHARGWGVLFEFEVAPDFEDPQAMIACVYQGGLGLPDRDDYFDASARGAALREAYRAHIDALLALDRRPDPAAAEAVLAFETRLAAASHSQRELARDVALRYHRIALEEADRATPAFPWSAFFAAQGVAPPAHFSLAMPAFHAAVDALLHEAPVETWQAYLRFHAIDDMAAYLDDDTAALHQRFHGQILRGQRQLAPRWKRVLAAIDAHIGEAMGRLHVAHTFPPAAKRAAEMLAEQLRAALRTRLERLDWMSDSTRALALRKLAAMRLKVGYPERWRDWSGLATSPRHWFANLLGARAFNQRWMLSRLGQPVDPTEWPLLPQTVNAGYDPQRNEIVFPAALLQPPFFAAEADAALNFGGIGAVIAHEMTHAFDDQGSRFGADGRFENWWGAADRARFEARAQRLIEQIEAWPSADGERVDGHLTLGENIADFGGLAIACDALEAVLAARGGADPLLDGYRQQQRFFLNWALIWRQSLAPAERQLRLRCDPHAPGRLRANAAAANLAAFARAFGCGGGEALDRPKAARIRIW